MNDQFYTTEPYKEARRRAETDLDNWPKGVNHHQRNRAVLGILCLGLSAAIILIWIGAYYHVRSHTQAPTITHKSSGL